MIAPESDTKAPSVILPAVTKLPPITLAVAVIVVDAVMAPVTARVVSSNVNLFVLANLPPVVATTTWSSVKSSTVALCNVANPDV